MLRVLFAAAVAIFAHVAAAQAQDRWVTLGSAELPPGAALVSLDASKAEGRFKAIRLLAKANSIVLSRLDFIYSDCQRQAEVGPISLKAGRQSRSIGLQDKEHFIDRITFEVAKPISRKTIVVVQGLQSETGIAARRSSLPAVRAGSLISSSSVHIDFAQFAEGAQSLWANFDIDLAADTQSLHSCERNSVFDEIQLHVFKADVFLKGLKITYYNDQTELISINTEIKRDMRTERIRLKGATPIREFQLWYEGRTKGRAHVEIHQNLSRELIRAIKAEQFTVALEIQGTEAVPLNMVTPRGCVSLNTCTPVAIFFGTNRKREDKDGRVGFGPDRVPVMSLGQAIVTIPKPHGIGKIERPSYWRVRDWLSLLAEDPVRHFTIPKEGIRVFETPEQFMAAVLAASKELPDFKDHAFVYVHGFTVQFDDALFRLAQLSYDLGVDRGDGKHVPFGLPFLFSWPTVGGVLDYATDSESARSSEAHLREFLELVVTKSQAKNVHLIGHSMGNQPLLQVMKQIASAAHPSIKFNQVILAAPDVDRDEFIKLAKVINPIAKNITLYASARDEAMILSRKVHSDRPRAGDVPKDGPVVLKEVHTIDATELNTGVFWTPGHSKYAEDTLLLQDIGRIVREGIMPPHDRTLSLGRRPVGDFWYWFFPRPKSPFG